MLWSLAYAGCIVAVRTRFSFKETIALAWVFGFVLIWLVISNLGVLPYGLLVYAIPLSLLETAVAAWIAQLVLKR
ncbi:MAG: hypothetical protein KGO94_14115 [Alphaproteobacteria bacterium]|nr:hypothetical protein [Alphaproteobacteria bacterium]